MADNRRKRSPLPSILLKLSMVFVCDLGEFDAVFPWRPACHFGWQPVESGDESGGPGHRPKDQSGYSPLLGYVGSQREVGTARAYILLNSKVSFKLSLIAPNY